MQTICETRLVAQKPPWRPAARVSLIQFFNDESVTCGIEQTNDPATCATSHDFGMVWLLPSQCAYISHLLDVTSCLITTHINEDLRPQGASFREGLHAGFMARFSWNFHLGLVSM